jgi:AcrR family transcriptional regulator
MKSPVKNRRVQKTRQALVEAMRALLVERKFDSITVQHVLDRADVGRSTFYSHFRDLDELTDAMHLKIFGSVHAALAQSAQSKKAGERRIGFSLALFELIYEWRRIYKRSAGGKFKLRPMLLGFINAGSPAARKNSPWDVLLPIYLAVTMEALIEWWMEQKEPMSPGEINEIYRQLVLPTLDKH